MNTIAHVRPGTRRLRSGGFFRAMRRHHMIHHHAGDVNFGFTTALWDRIFGTYATHAKRAIDIERPPVAVAPVSIEARTMDTSWVAMDLAGTSPRADRSSSTVLGT